MEHVSFEGLNNSMSFNIELWYKFYVKWRETFLILSIKLQNKSPQTEGKNCPFKLQNAKCTHILIKWTKNTTDKTRE